MKIKVSNTTNTQLDWLVAKCEGKNGSTPLIATMRCYVSSKLGDEVEVPDELCK